MSEEGVVIYKYLSLMMENEGATDIYITVGVPITFRVSNMLEPVDENVMTDESIQSILEEILTPKQLEEFDNNNECNMALDRGGEGRFRINVLRQRGHSGIVIRKITSDIPSFDDLSLPEGIKSLALEKRGMVLIVGVTSSGKSTTLASMIDYRNTTTGGHIVTIEDPVEYYHQHKVGIITQREVGVDTNSYHAALKNALRQKPDVILVGEIRDTEVMEQAIVAAETGHLCYATLHTANAPQAIDRIINFFQEDRHQQIRIALASNLRAVVAQRLVARIGGGLVVLLEIMLNEGLIRELILKGDTKSITKVMEDNTRMGMTTFDISLLNLYKEGLITEETALKEAALPTDLKMQIQSYDMSKADPEGKNEGGAMANVDTSELSL